MRVELASAVFRLRDHLQVVVLYCGSIHHRVHNGETATEPPSAQNPQTRRPNAGGFREHQTMSPRGVDSVFIQKSAGLRSEPYIIKDYRSD